MIKIEQTLIPAEKAMTLLALEAYNKDNIFDKSFELLPSIASSLTANAQSLQQSLASFVKDKASFLASFVFGNDLPNDFSLIANKAIKVPEGFKGHFIDYIQDLNDSLDYFENVTQPQLKEFYITVSSFVTNKSAKLSIKDDKPKFDRQAKQREEINKSISKKFTTANLGKASASDAFGSTVEVNECVKKTNLLVKKVESYSLNSIIEQCKKIASVLDIAIKSAQNNEYKEASKESLINLANGTYELAYQVEFISVTIYRVKALKFAMDETIKSLKN